LPEGDGCGSACRNAVIFCDWTTLAEHVLEIIIEPLVFSGIIDGQVDFIVDFPAPAIVIHRSHVDIPPVSEVDL